jgi:hypothetical protein
VTTATAAELTIAPTGDLSHSQKPNEVRAFNVLTTTSFQPFYHTRLLSHAFRVARAMISKLKRVKWSVASAHHS